MMKKMKKRKSQANKASVEVDKILGWISLKNKPSYLKTFSFSPKQKYFYQLSDLINCPPLKKYSTGFFNYW